MNGPSKVRRAWLLWACPAAVAFAQTVAAPPPTPRQMQDAFHDALRRVAPCVVRIDTIGGAPRVQAFGEQRAAVGFRQADGPTTGVIWSADGEIVTSSFNFIRDPSIITVTLADGRRFVARLVARDLPARLALLKIDAQELPAARGAPLERLRPGQWALTAGYGHGGSEPSVSAGVLSATRRMNGLAAQTDAKTSPANYGGPLFDLDGRVIGVCVPLAPQSEDEIAGVEWYDSGTGFAIHVEQINERMGRMRAGGDLRRGLLGLLLDLRDPIVGDDRSADAPPAGAPSRGEPTSQPNGAGSLPGPPTSQPRTPTSQPRTPASQPRTPASQPGPPASQPGAATSHPNYAAEGDGAMRVSGSQRPAGIVVLEAPAGPAAEAGLQAGDIVTHLNGEPTPDRVAFQRELARYYAGDEVGVTYWRAGLTTSVPVRLAARDAEAFRREGAPPG